MASSLASSTVSIGKAGTDYEGFTAEGWVNLLGVFHGEGKLHVSLDHVLQGRATGSLTLPGWLGGGTLAEILVLLNNDGATCIIPLDWLFIENVGVRFDNRAPWVHFLVNVDVEEGSMMVALPPGLLWLTPPASKVFDLPAGRDQAIFRIRWSAGNADILVHRPSGGTIAPAASPEHGADYDYFKNPDELQAVVIVGNPAEGAWTVEIPETTGIGVYAIELLGLNGAPSIEVTEPSVAVGPQPSYGIEWTASDPDDDALVSLYYDTDNVGANGVLIVDGLAETRRATSVARRRADGHLLRLRAH